MRAFRGILTGLALALSACATPEAKGPAPAQPSAASAASEGPAARIGTLPAQDLVPGSCGLYLFDRQAGRRLVFAADDTVAEARMQIDGKLRRLPRLEAKGEATGRFFPETRYTGEGVSVSVSYVAEVNPGLAAGAVIREGRLTFEEANGWSYVMPVAGLIACRTAQE